MSTAATSAGSATVAESESVKAGFGARIPFAAAHEQTVPREVLIPAAGRVSENAFAPPPMSTTDTDGGRRLATETSALSAGTCHTVSQIGSDVGTSQAATASAQPAAAASPRMGRG